MVYDSITPQTDSLTVVQKKDQKMFHTNQIVKAKFGVFIVLGYRVVAGENLVQVKPYNPQTGKSGRGEIAFPENSLQIF